MSIQQTPPLWREGQKCRAALPPGGTAAGPGPPLVIIKNPAGSAKTFYTLAARLEQVLEQDSPTYRKLLICRPNTPFGADTGFLPGDKQEKFSPLMQPIADNYD